jgi:hypothetical protein
MMHGQKPIKILLLFKEPTNQEKELILLSALKFYKRSFESGGKWENVQHYARGM